MSSSTISIEDLSGAFAIRLQASGHCYSEARSHDFVDGICYLCYALPGRGFKPAICRTLGIKRCTLIGSLAWIGCSVGIRA